MTVTVTAIGTARRTRELTPLQAALSSDEVSGTLYRFVLRKVKREQEAEDLVQATMEIALKRDLAGHGWSGEPPPVIVFLGSILNGELANKWKTDKRRAKVVRPAGQGGTGRGADAEGQTESTIDDAPSETANAEEEMAGREEREKREREEDEIKAATRAYLATQDDGRIPLGMLEAYDAGVRKAAKIAERLGCSVQEVYDGRDRIKRAMERVAKERELGVVGEKGATS
jgi:DNA-directed RNA polymerase specialized sigma24 family protein